MNVVCGYAYMIGCNMKILCISLCLRPLNDHDIGIYPQMSSC